MEHDFAVVRAFESKVLAPAASGQDLLSAGDALAHGYCGEELDSLRLAGRASVGPPAGGETSRKWRHFEFDLTGRAGSLE
jgi:hypothetical protein